MKSYSQNIVIDLEFTQVDQKYKRRTFRQEIIQIGSVRVSPSGEVLDSFSSFVRPEYTSSVSVKVRDLTGIRFRDVYDENPLSVVLELFREWVGEEGRTRLLRGAKMNLSSSDKKPHLKRLNFQKLINDGWISRRYTRVLWQWAMGKGCRFIRQQIGMA